MEEGAQLADSGLAVVLCDDEDGGSGGDNFHDGAAPVADAAVVDGADVVDDGVVPYVGCGHLGVPCDPHDSPDDAHYGAEAQVQGEP